MPGLPLDQVRYQEGMNPWQFPRLFVDGNSWLWKFAIEDARDTLLDHDGSIQEKIDRSEKEVEDELVERPKCPECGEFRVAKQTSEYIWYARCYRCEPETFSKTDFGIVETFERQPPKSSIDQCCRRRVWSFQHRGEDVCWLVRGHEGICEPSFIRSEKQ